MISSEIQHFLNLAEESHEVGHYGGQHEDVTEEQAKESFQWAEEFKQAVEAYLDNLT